MKMTFLKLFLICTFKEIILAEKGQIWQNIFFKVELRGVHRVRFFQVRPPIGFPMTFSLRPNAH